jgi:hypothetical protein
MSMSNWMVLKTSKRLDVAKILLKRILFTQ